MNKPDLVVKLHLKMPWLTEKQVKAAVDLIPELITSEVCSGGRCEFRMFGNFESRLINRRTRDPRLNEDLGYRKSTKIKFQQSKKWMQDFNGIKPHGS